MLVAALAVGSGLPASPPRPAVPTVQASEQLRVGEPVKREISPGETHAFSLPVEAGQYLRVVARAQTMDVALRLVAADGGVLATADGPGGSRKPELLSLLTTATERARLQISRQDHGERRRYVLVLEEQRPVRDNDALRIAAEHAYREAVHRRSLGSAEETRRALQVLQPALLLWQKVGDRRGEVDTLNFLGLLHRALDEVEQAVDCFSRSLALAETESYPQGLIEALNGKARLDWRLVGLDAAAQSYRRALDIARAQGAAELEATTRQNLGMLLLDRGALNEAREHLERALALWQDLGDLGEEGNTALALGFIKLQGGSLDEAIHDFQRALLLARSASDRRTEAVAIFHMASIHRRRRQLQAALISYREATERLRAYGDSGLQVIAQEALAALYSDFGDLDRAAHHYREVETFYRQQGDVNARARVLTSVGLVDQRRGDFATAREAFEQALAISLELKNARTEATARQRLGALLRDIGDLAAAKESLLAARELLRSIGDRSAEASALIDLATCESRQGAAEMAKAHFGEAHALARAIESPALEAVTLQRWAAHERDSGALVNALEKIQAARQVVESTRSSVLSRDLRAIYFGSQRDHAELHIDVLMRLDQLQPDSGYRAAALEVSEWSRARTLLELLAEGRIDLESGLGPELKTRELRLEEQAQQIRARLTALLSAAEADSQEVVNLRQELTAVGDELQEVEAETRRQHPRYAEIRYPRPMRLAEIRGLLDEGSALLEYFLGVDSSFLFVVKRDSLSCYRLPPAREIAGLVTRLRRGLETTERRRWGDFVVAARQLYETLVAPAALEGVTNLIIVPDRVLHLLPFEALLATRTMGAGSSWREQPFLIKQYSVAYVPSATVLASLRAQPARDGATSGEPLRFVAFADPPSGPNLPSALPQLPGARSEVLAIAGRYDSRGVALFLGAEASEDNVKSGAHLEQAERIHFATHAVVDRAVPELTALVLASHQGSAEDGFLHAYEIFDLRLGADLVVLSGCDTALGREVSGEGLIGLTQALFFAGARSVVASLWPVADVAAPSLMPEFYQRLDRDASKAVALQQTKLHMLDTDGWAHPFYWAQFVLVGDGGSKAASRAVTNARLPRRSHQM